MNCKSLIISTIIVMITIAWLFRYDIEYGSERAGYRLDRWTGNVDWILGDEMHRVKSIKQN